MIRNLVFDVGGVLLEYRWQDMFRQQGLSEEEIGKLEQVLFRDEIWAWKLDLKEKGYRIYLLSNYSQEMFEKHTKGASFLKVLDGGVISYQIHAIKPDHEIYETLLKRYDLKPEECVFLDDRLENVEGGKRAGMEAVQITSREMLHGLLNQILEADMGRWKPEK